jgi:hypothetical protein
MDAKEEIAVVPIEAPPTPSPPNLMDKEEETQSEAPKDSELAEITKITEENKTLKTEEQEEEDNQITETGTVKNIDAAVKEISGSEAAEEPVKEEIKEALIAPNNATKETGETVAAETTELVKEEPEDQSDVAPVSATLVSETGGTVAAETTELVKEEPEDQSVVAPVSATLVSETGVASVTPNPEEQTKDPDCSTDARTDTETHEEDKGVEELVKEEIKETDLPNHATPVAVTETIDETKDAEPNHEEENKVVELPHATPATETVNESANLQPEAKLPEVETEGTKFQDTSVAATGEEEEENKETELVKEVIKESELPDSSLAVTPVVDGESMPETKTTDTGAVTEVHTVKDKASDELKVENTDASPVLAESADVEGVESEVTQVLPEKKKKRPLGDHLAEEKANDSVTANKQVSDEKSEVEPSEVEQTATAIAPKESTEISSRDANTTQSEADGKKQEDEKAAREVTATEFAQEGEGEKIAEKESAPAGEAAKEEVASKLTSRSSNNILSKVKHQIVKVKKAIVRKSPSSKNMPVEKKDDIKVK